MSPRLNHYLRLYNDMNTNTQKGYGVPAAIIVAGLLIAGAVVFSGGGSTASTTTENHAGSQPSSEFRMPSEDDHVRGSLDAPIKIVEFSDFECPFCGRIHPTLTRIVEENDDVAWVYRHFPLSSHSNAFSAAVASECVARVGGNDAFWNFADNAFANQRQLGNGFYESFVRDAGLDVNAFMSCLTDDQVASEVQRDLDEVIAVGGRGTPHVVVVTANNELIPFSGALPYEQVMSVVEQARSN